MLSTLLVLNRDVLVKKLLINESTPYHYLKRVVDYKLRNIRFFNITLQISFFQCLLVQHLSLSVLFKLIVLFFSKCSLFLNNAIFNIFPVLNMSQFLFFSTFLLAMKYKTSYFATRGLLYRFILKRNLVILTFHGFDAYQILFYVFELLSIFGFHALIGTTRIQFSIKISSVSVEFVLSSVLIVDFTGWFKKFLSDLSAWFTKYQTSVTSSLFLIFTIFFYTSKLSLLFFKLLCNQNFKYLDVYKEL